MIVKIGIDSQPNARPCGTGAVVNLSQDQKSLEPKRQVPRLLIDLVGILNVFEIVVVV